MDFSTFDNRPRAEAGEWLHLVHPETGAPLYLKAADGSDDTEKPCRVLLRGQASPTVQAALRRARHAQMQQERKGADDRRAGGLEELHRTFVDLSAPFIIEFENVIRDGRAATAPADVDWFLNLVFPFMGKDGIGNRPFGYQISEFVTDAEAWRGNG